MFRGHQTNMRQVPLNNWAFAWCLKACCKEETILRPPPLFWETQCQLETNQNSCWVPSCCCIDILHLSTHTLKSLGPLIVGQHLLWCPFHLAVPLGGSSSHCPETGTVRDSAGGARSEVDIASCDLLGSDAIAW